MIGRQRSTRCARRGSRRQYTSDDNEEGKTGSRLHCSHRRGAAYLLAVQTWLEGMLEDYSVEDTSYKGNQRILESVLMFLSNIAIPKVSDSDHEGVLKKCWKHTHDDIPVAAACLQGFRDWEGSGLRCQQAEKVRPYILK